MNRIGRLLPALVLGLGLLYPGLPAFAQNGEGDSSGPNFARTGFYIAAGGVNIPALTAVPHGQ